VRHLLRALGVQGRIKSPTYAVVEPHEVPSLNPSGTSTSTVSAIPREWEDAGFRDVFASPGLKLAEWPEKAAALIPAADVAIHIEAPDEELPPRHTAGPHALSACNCCKDCTHDA
jgi:tRNA threonylcarbamoyladenosine biosynthesis protein TsaE